MATGSVAELSIVVTGKDQLSAVLSGASSSVKEFNSLLESLQGSLALLGNESSATSLQELSAVAAASGQSLGGLASEAASSGQGLAAMAEDASNAANGLSEAAAGAQEAGGAAEEAGSGAGSAGEGFNALGAGTKIASQGLSSAGEAARGFGVDIGPANEAGRELINVVKEAGSGLEDFVIGAGVAAVAIAGIGAAFVGEVLGGAEEFGMSLVHLSELSGMTEDSLAGMEVRLTEVGLDADSAQRSIAFLARQMETLSVGDASQAQADIASALKATATASREVADAQRALGDAYAETQGRIADATSQEAQNLDDLAAKHADTIAKIKADIATLTADYQDAEATRREDYRDAQKDRQESERDSLNTLAENHAQAMARIAQRQRAATTAQARASAALAAQQENADYQRSVAAEQKRAVKADADAKKRYDKEEKRAAEAYQKRLAALDKELKDEDEKYNAQVAREQKRYDDELKRLNDSYAKQEQATAEHIARINEMQAEKSAPGGGSESAFEIELRKILGFAGQTKAQTDSLFESIADGEKTVGDILPLIAEGFKNQAEEAEKNGTKVNLAGEAMKIFGRSGYQMLPFLLEGGEAFKNDAALAEEFGLAMDPERTKEYTKAHADLMWALKGIEIQLGTALMPLMTKWMTELTTWVTTHRQEIVGFFEKVGLKVLDLGRFLAQYGPSMIHALQTVGEAIAHVLEVTSGTKNLEDALQRWGQAFQRVGEAFVNVYNVLILPVIDLIGGFIALLNGDWHKALSDWHDALSNFLGFDVAEAGRPFVQFKNMIATWLGEIRNLDWSGMWAGFKSFGTDAVNAIIDAINWLIRGLDKIQIGIPKKIGGIPIPGGGGSFGVNIPTIPPFRAEGGPVLGGMPYIVGERGPELFVPRDSGSIVPNGQLGGGLTLQFYGPVSLGNDASGREQLKQVGFAVQAHLRTRGVKL